MQDYAQEICRTRFLVGLRIEVEAPGVLAAIRPWSDRLSYFFSSSSSSPISTRKDGRRVNWHQQTISTWLLEARKKISLWESPMDKSSAAALRWNSRFDFSLGRPRFSSQCESAQRWFNPNPNCTLRQGWALDPYRDNNKNNPRLNDEKVLLWHVGWICRKDAVQTVILEMKVISSDDLGRNLRGQFLYIDLHRTG